MPKTTSKKAQKKGAKGGDDARFAYTDREDEDQMWARALRLLGSRNVLLYCNDDRVRIGHICNRMKFRSWVEVGDIVLISIREFEKVDDEKKDTRRADILAKYTPDHRSMLKKEKGFNLRLIQPLESSGIDLSTLGLNMSSKAQAAGDEEDYFEEEEDEEDEEDEESEDKTAKTKKKLPKKQESKVAAADMEAGEEELDIDAI
jgi:translation initiation factor 1A